MIERMHRVEHEHNKEINSGSDLVVVVDSLNVGVDELIPFVETVLKTASKSNVDTQILLAMHRGLDSNSDDVDERMRKEFPGIARSVIVDKNTFAFAYLKGLEEAMNLADRVIEIDSGGGHDPNEITRFIEGLDNYDIVLSSRFMEGGKNTYPLQRRTVSKTVTVLSNQFLGTDVTDAASGFQAFRSEALRDLFDKTPPEEWISARYGPFHMYQTEIMSRLAKMKDYTSTEVPITYGVGKEGQPFPASYLVESMVCFFRIAQSNRETKRKLDEE